MDTFGEKSSFENIPERFSMEREINPAAPEPMEAKAGGNSINLKRGGRKKSGIKGGKQDRTPMKKKSMKKRRKSKKRNANSQASSIRKNTEVTIVVGPWEKLRKIRNADDKLMFSTPS